MKKTISLALILLFIPIVSAEMYIDNSWGIPIEYYTETEIECDLLINSIDYKWYKDLRLIRVWDLNITKGQPKGLYFLSNIIHIYDGCRNRNTLIHELAHLDRQSIKHDSWFWLSYYRIKITSQH